MRTSSSGRDRQFEPVVSLGWCSPRARPRRRSGDRAARAVIRCGDSKRSACPLQRGCARSDFPARDPCGSRGRRSTAGASRVTRKARRDATRARDRAPSRFRRVAAPWLRAHRPDTEPVWRLPVVVIPVHDDLASREIAGAVALLAEDEPPSSATYLIRGRPGSNPPPDPRRRRARRAPSDRTPDAGNTRSPVDQAAIGSVWHQAADERNVGAGCRMTRATFGIERTIFGTVTKAPTRAPARAVEDLAADETPRVLRVTDVEAQMTEPSTCSSRAASRARRGMPHPRPASRSGTGRAQSHTCFA